MKNLKKMIEPFILRRIKKDVLTELPDKNITVLKSEMTSEQQKLYFSYISPIFVKILKHCLNLEGYHQHLPIQLKVA